MDTMRKNKLFVIVVLYNLRILESPVVNVIGRDSTYSNLVIIDNSNQSRIFLENKHYCSNNRILYLGDGINYGLSKAYNMAISFLIENHIDFDFITIFDQDTSIPDSFFKQLINKINDYSSRDPVLLYPIVQTQIHGRMAVLSPRNVFRSKYTGNFFINSGITFSKTVVENCKYNENIFLDFVDYEYLMQIRFQFCKELKEISTGIIIFQDFSGSKFSSIDSDYTRFLIFAKDLREFAKSWPSYRLIVYLLLLKRCIRLTTHYLTISLALFA